MNVFLIIILTVVVSLISSLDFRASRNKVALKQMGSNKKAKVAAQFVEIYPGFHLFWNLISLLAMIWIACLASLTWGLFAGCFIALALISLARLLGQRIVPLTDQMLLKWSPFIVKYFNWVGLLNVLVKTHRDDPIDDVDELVALLRQSKIDCPTQLSIEKTLKLNNMPINQVMIKWAEVSKVSYKDKLTPVRIDELFQSRQKIFPVIRNSVDDVVGLLHLSDVQTIGQTEKKLLDSMHRNFIVIDSNDLVPTVLQMMAESETTVAIVHHNKKIVGMVNLADILAIQPICQPLE